MDFDSKIETVFLDVLDKKYPENCPFNPYQIDEIFILFKEGFRKGEAEGFAKANKKETPEENL